MANPYADESGVFLNKLGVTDAEQLKSLEYNITRRKSADLLHRNVLGKAQSFDLARLQAIHRYIFQDVYEWAGKIRTLSSKKRAANGMVSAFAEPDEIVRDWEALARKTNAFAAASDLAFEQKREELLDIFIEANRIHPFPEGNGRSLQVFMRELARAQGVFIDYDKVDKHDWNLACAVSGTHGVLFERMYLIPSPPDREPISKIFAVITNPDRGLAERRNDQPQQDEPRPGIPQGNRQASVLTAAATDENTVEAALANYIEEAMHKGERIEDRVENLINIVADAEAVQSEQRAMLDGASIEQTYEATLANYAEAMHNRVARLEDRLENLFKQQEARVQQTKENAPGMFSLPGKKRAWRAKSVREEAKLQTLHNCLEVVREIRKGTDPRAPRIEELATRRMRAKNPELASSWDAMRLERKKQEKAEKSLRAQQWAEDKIGLKEEKKRQEQELEEQPGHSRGRGRSLSLRHPR